MKTVLFSLLIFFQKMLRGSGLGKIVILQILRNKLYLLLRSGKQTVEIAGIKLIIDNGKGKILPGFMYQLWGGEYEPLTTRLFLEGVGDGNVVDVGANIGYFSVLAAKMIKGVVVGFEPVQENYDLLVQNIALNGASHKIQAIKMAVASEPGRARLYIDGRNSLLHHLYYSTDRGDDGMVDVTSIDVSMRKYQYISMLKVDVEGWENFVLTGALKTIRRNPKIKMIWEFNPELLIKAGCGPGVFIHRFRELGFNVQGIDEELRALIDFNSASFAVDYCVEHKPGFMNILVQK